MAAALRRWTGYPRATGMNDMHAYGVVQINGTYLAVIADALMEAVHWPPICSRTR